MQYSGNHFVQFHKNSATLAKEVAAFIEAGLTADDGVVVIATAAHTTLIVQELIRKNIDSIAYQEKGQLHFLDADATLAGFMSISAPSWPKFRDAINSTISQLRKGGFEKVRAYGEMVDILWRKGNTGAAIQLEDYWNDVAQMHNLSLLCAYVLDGLSEASYSGPLHEIGRTHSQILPSDDDDRLQTAIDQASNELLGTPLSRLVSLSGSEPGEERLPTGRRTVLWLKRTMPLKVNEILDRARRNLENENPLDGSPSKNPPLNTL